MKNYRQFFVVLILVLLSESLLLGGCISSIAEVKSTPDDVYFGIDVGYEVDVQAAKAAIDQVCNFTNFFVLGNYKLCRDITGLNETLQYAYDKGMYFMSYPPTLGFDPELIDASKVWLSYA